MVPMFTCGLLRSNFSLAIAFSTPHSNSLKRDYKSLRLLSRLARIFRDYLFRNRSGRFRVVRKMHGEVAAALGTAAPVGGVAEHLGPRHFHADDVATGAIFRALNRGTPRVEIAKDGRHIFFRDDDLRLHD